MGGVINRGTKDKPLWYVRYIDTDGKRKQRKTGAPTKALARRVLDEVEGRIALGMIGVPAPTDEERLKRTRTVGELADRFLAEYAPPSVKDVHAYRVQARSIFKRRILPTLGNMPAASVRMVDVERMRDAALRSGKAGNTVGNMLRALGKLFNWARRVGLIDCTNPASGIEKPRPVRSLDYLSRDEVDRLLAHLEAHAADLVWPMAATAIYAGLRKGELAGLRWCDVDLERKRLDVLRSYRTAPKSGKPRHVPINPELLPILRAWRTRCPAMPEQLVFPVRGKSGKLRMGRRDDDHGLPKLLVSSGCHVPAMAWHSLRHTFAAHAVMAGIKLYTVQKMLGHSTPEMTQIYAHLAPDYLAGEMMQLSFSPRPGATVADLGDVRQRRLTDHPEGVNSSAVATMRKNVISYLR